MAQQIPGPLIYDEKSSTNNRAFFAGMPLDAGLTNPDYICAFDDFSYEHGKALNATDMYDTSVKDSGASAAIVSTLGGMARILSANTTDNDGGLIQSGSTGPCFAFQSGKKLWFEARVKVLDADDGEMFVGLAKCAATNPENVIASTLARVGFELVEGSADLRFSCNNGTDDSKTSCAVSMADTTFIKLGFFYDGSAIDVYVDRVKKLSGISPRVTLTTDLLGFSFFHLSGAATSQHYGDIDYWMVVAER